MLFGPRWWRSAPLQTMSLTRGSCCSSSLLCSASVWASCFWGWAEMTSDCYILHCMLWLLWGEEMNEERRLVLVEVLVGNSDLHLSPGDSPHLLQGVLKNLECILIPEVSERQDRSHCRREQFVEHLLSIPFHSFPSRHLLDSAGRCACLHVSSSGPAWPQWSLALLRWRFTPFRSTFQMGQAENLHEINGGIMNLWWVSVKSLMNSSWICLILWRLHCSFLAQLLSIDFQGLQRLHLFSSYSPFHYSFEAVICCMASLVCQLRYPGCRCPRVGTNKSLDHFIRISSGWCGWYS